MFRRCYADAPAGQWEKQNLNAESGKAETLVRDKVPPSKAD
jgi:hypothetical protein